MARKALKAKSKPTLIVLENYSPDIQVFEDPEHGFIFCLMLHDKDSNTIVNVNSNLFFPDAECAIEECSGIIEALGFKQKGIIEILVHFWDYESEEFNDDVVYYDGKDFFKEPPEQDEDEDDDGE